MQEERQASGTNWRSASEGSPSPRRQRPWLIRTLMVVVDIKLHVERFEEHLADRRSLLQSVEPIPAANPDDGGLPPPASGHLASSGRGRA